MHGNEAKRHPEKSDCLYHSLVLEKIYDCLHRSFFSCLKILVDIELFDLYMDEAIGNDKKQLAYKLTFMDSEKTLESADVEKVIKSILNRLEFTYKATLRQ